MKKATILILSFLITGIIYGQHIPNNIAVFKLYFKDKQIDSTGFKFFQFLSAKEKKTENNGDPVDVRFENECKCVVYSNYEDSIPGLTIIHDIDTMKLTIPAYLIYLDKVPFEKGKFVLLGNVPDVSYEEQQNYKYWNQTFKFDFCEGCKFRNYSLYSWNVVKVAGPTVQKTPPPKKKK